MIVLSAAMVAEARCYLTGHLPLLAAPQQWPRVACAPDINSVVNCGGGADTAAMSMDLPDDESMKQLVTGVGQVCVAASGLDWALTYLTGVIEIWAEAKFTAVVSQPGGPLKAYRKLVPRLEAFGVGPDAAQLADDAGSLLGERNRVVHSVMMTGTRAANESLYEAWHARTDAMWAVVPEDLNRLAQDLSQCAAEATAFAEAWQERAERDGWPDLSGSTPG